MFRFDRDLFPKRDEDDDDDLPPQHKLTEH
jgi:hypothetical protein